MATEMVDLPEEIINLIGSFTFGPTRKILRSTCKKWRAKLFDNNLTFYFTNKTSILPITEHILINYSNIPISIQFRKSVDREMKYYAQYLAKLTNLTSLSLDRPDRDNAEWLRLTTLTNLIYFDNCPMILQHIFTQLRSFNYNKLQFGAYEHWPRYTNLEAFQLSLTIVNRHNDPLSFISNPTRLTSLIIKNNSISTTDEDLPKLFTNLRKFECFENTGSNDEFRPDLLTSLEYLKIAEANFENIGRLIHLTKLVLSSQSSFDIGQLSALTKLKRLKFADSMFQIEEDQLKFLADLTALERFGIEVIGLTGKFFKWINRSNLTNLACWYAGNQPAHFKFLTNLIKLDLFARHKDIRINHDYISDLTLLTSFECHTWSSNITFLMQFTNLKKLVVPGLYTVSTLPNLENLACMTVSDEVFNEFRLLTKLTSLKMYVSQHQNELLTILSQLPLRKFYNGTKNEPEEFFSELSRMTALERLTLSNIDDLSILQDLTRLTRLESYDEVKNFDGLTLLTSLQRVELTPFTKSLPKNIRSHLTRLSKYT